MAAPTPAPAQEACRCGQPFQHRRITRDGELVGDYLFCRHCDEPCTIGTGCRPCRKGHGAPTASPGPQ